MRYGNRQCWSMINQIYVIRLFAPKYVQKLLDTCNSWTVPTYYPLGFESFLGRNIRSSTTSILFRAFSLRSYFSISRQSTIDDEFSKCSSAPNAPQLVTLIFSRSQLLSTPEWFYDAADAWFPVSEHQLPADAFSVTMEWSVHSSSPARSRSKSESYFESWWFVSAECWPFISRAR